MQTQLLTITACQKLRLRLRLQGCGLFAKSPYYAQRSQIYISWKRPVWFGINRTETGRRETLHWRQRFQAQTALPGIAPTSSPNRDFQPTRPARVLTFSFGRSVAQIPLGHWLLALKCKLPLWCHCSGTCGIAQTETGGVWLEWLGSRSKPTRLHRTCVQPSENTSPHRGYPLAYGHPAVSVCILSQGCDKSQIGMWVR